MNPIYSVRSLSFLLVVVLVVALGLVAFWLLRRGSGSQGSARRLALGRPGFWPALCGLSALVAVGVAEGRMILRSGSVPPSPGGFSVLRSAAPAGASPDRLQCLFVVSDRHALTAASEIEERIVRLPLDPESSVGIEVGQLNTRCEAHWPDRTDLGTLRFESRTRPLFGSYQVLMQTGGSRVELGDGRAFVLAGRDRQTWPGFSLRLPVERRFQILVRPLFPGDRLEPLVGAAARPILERGLVGLPALMLLGSGSGTLAPAPIVRLLREVNPVGLLVLSLGLVLLLWRRVSLMRGAVLLAVILVSMLSTASRADLWHGRARLRDPDPSVRIASAVRLASLRALAPSAAEELLEHFVLEPESGVRSAVLRATGVADYPLDQLEAARELHSRARSDPDPTVQATLARIESSRPPR